MSDVRDLLLGLQHDLRGVQLAAPAAVRLRGDRRRRTGRALVAALLALVVVAAGAVRLTQAAPPPPTNPTPHGTDGVVHITGWTRALALDPATGSLYTVQADGRTVSIVPTGHCKASDTSGCSHAPRSLSMYHPYALGLSTVTHTLYVANWEAGVSVVDTTTCNGGDAQDCAVHTPSTREAPALALAVDDEAYTLFVAGLDDMSGGGGTFNNFSVPRNDLPAAHIALFDTRTCNARELDGCTTAAASIPLRGVPQAITVDAATQTVYVVTTATTGQTTLWVLGGASCRAASTSGCGVRAHVVLGTETSVVLSATQGLAIDDRTHSLYVTSAAHHGVLVFDTSRCNASLASCSQAATISGVSGDPDGLAIDPATDTVYVVNSSDARLERIDGRHCNASDRSGCTPRWSRLPPAGADPAAIQPAAIVLDQANHTVYVAEAATGVAAVETHSRAD